MGCPTATFGYGGSDWGATELGCYGAMGAIGLWVYGAM